MNIKEKAKNFAIRAHAGQVRKSDPGKPMIIHPINVGNILNEYGFDDNVISAGYLHDVVEDTKYKLSDIVDNFGDDIASLVEGASEPDKSLSWEERKEHTISSIKELDLRHKAIICADKISNLEDLHILFGISGKKDFSKFKRGFDKQKWYYEGVYCSLILNEDEFFPMFVRLKELIDYVFNDKCDNFIKNEIFKDNSLYYDELVKINFRNDEIFKLNSVLCNTRPFVIEFTGTPRTGKTSLINNLYDFFKKKGFSVVVLEEFTTSKKYKEEIFPSLKGKSKKIINTEIPKYVYKQLNDAMSGDYEIILVDRSLFDRLIWADRLYLMDGFSLNEYNDYIDKYISVIKNNIDIIIGTYVDSITALRRDYFAHLSLGNRSFLNTSNIDSYNKSFFRMKDLAFREKINFYDFNTFNKSMNDVSFEVVNVLLSHMKETYIKRIFDEFDM